MLHYAPSTTCAMQLEPYTICPRREPSTRLTSKRLLIPEIAFGPVFFSAYNDDNLNLDESLYNDYDALYTPPPARDGKKLNSYMKFLNN